MITFRRSGGLPGLLGELSRVGAGEQEQGFDGGVHPVVLGDGGVGE